jgi:hypothetical protein
VCNETGETYYGSTTQTLAKRLATHRTDAKTKPCTSKQIIERGNYDIILCEECPCENKEQLIAIERKWIEGNECVNRNVPGRTPKERYADNKVEKLQYQKKYGVAHTDEIKQYKKQYQQQYGEEIKQRKKIYYEANKERIKQKNKEYYQKTKNQVKK